MANDEILLWLLSVIDGPDFLPDTLVDSEEAAKEIAQAAEDADGGEGQLEWDVTFGAGRYTEQNAESTTGSFNWNIQPVSYRGRRLR